MDKENTGTMVGGLWFFSALVLAALFLGAGIMSDFTTAHALLAIVILALNVVGTVYLLNWRGGEAPAQKSKRQDLDNLLHNLSDEQLHELQQRLAQVNDAPIMDVGDDGELIQRR